MKFTIGIPVRNGEKYLSQTIRSALSQRRPANEVLVVDDASTDGTKDICTSSEWGGQVRYVYNENSTGFAEAFNRVGELANGSFYVPLSADDLLNPEYLLHVEAALHKYPSARFCYTACDYISSDGLHLKSAPEPHEFEPQLIRGPDYSRRYVDGVWQDRHIHRCVGIALERNLFLRHCRFRKEAGLINDDDVFYRIGRYTDVIGISAPLASVRIHGDSVSSRLDSLTLQLAQDYVFQLRSITADPGCLDNESIIKITRMGDNLINCLMGEALRLGQPGRLRKALELAGEYQRLTPGDYQSSRSVGETMKFQVASLLANSSALMAVYSASVPYLRTMKRRLRNSRV